MMMTQISLLSSIKCFSDHCICKILICHSSITSAHESSFEVRFLCMQSEFFSLFHHHVDLDALAFEIFIEKARLKTRI